MTQHARAIVTLTLGEAYRRLWREHARPSWEHYAERHGLDVIALDAPLDDSVRASSRSPAWQKLLVLEQPFAQAYDQIVWLDADIAIHPEAPSVFAGVPADRVGAVEEFGNPTPQIYREATQRWSRLAGRRGEFYRRDDTPQDFYRLFGFEDGFDHVVHSGVMVLSPRHHREILRRVYEEYEELPGQGTLMEMRPLSYELLRAGVVHWLDKRFALLWQIYKAERFPFLMGYPEHPLSSRCVATALAEAFFLHFAGGAYPEVAQLAGEPELPRPPRAWTAPRPPAHASGATPCETPVGLIFFNRPSTTARVFEAVRAVRPRRLFLIADGPRVGHSGDEALCAEVRALVSAVDWECDVRTNYAAVNLGLKRRVESGLDWLFDQVEEAIVLEDDCLPHASFFPFCAELLERHRDDATVMTISGSDFKFGLSSSPDSYAFSRYPLVWGWATWRRAWRHYDRAMRAWPEAFASGWLQSLLQNPRAVDYWSYVLQENAERPHTWDYNWVFSSWRCGGLSIHPNTNLVANIGFGVGASHTHDRRDALAELPLGEMIFPLRHPPAVVRDDAADRLVEQTAFSGSLDRLWLRLRQSRRGRRRESAPR